MAFNDKNTGRKWGSLGTEFVIKERIIKKKFEENDKQTLKIFVSFGHIFLSAVIMPKESTEIKEQMTENEAQ